MKKTNQQTQAIALRNWRLPDLTQERDTKKLLSVLVKFLPGAVIRISSNRGLTGGYQQVLLKEIWEQLCSIVVIGKKEITGLILMLRIESFEEDPIVRYRVGLIFAPNQPVSSLVEEIQLTLKNALAVSGALAKSKSF